MLCGGGVWRCVVLCGGMWPNYFVVRLLCGEAKCFCHVVNSCVVER